MKELLILIFFSIIMIVGFFYPTISYLRLYLNSQKKWIKVVALKTGEVAYPKSFGLVPFVEYEYNSKNYKIEVYKASFSNCPTNSQVEIMVNPENPEICVLINKSQFTKNVLALIILGLIFISAIIYGIFLLSAKSF